MSGLEPEFHGEVRFRTVPSLQPEAKAAVARFGWASHGLLIRKGSAVLYLAGDHRANGYDASVALKEILGLPLDCR
ncbi:MAG: hypothetical protein JNM17_33835 [Archangium sp.]|nr:hypothetical protein [Archangium sp.]